MSTTDSFQAEGFRTEIAGVNLTDSDWWFHASQSHSEPPPSNGLRTVRSPPRAKVLSGYEQAEDWLREVR